MRNLLIVGMMVLPFANCSCHKNKPAANAPATSAGAKPPVFKNDCEKAITVKDGDISTAAGANIVMVQQSPNLVCHATFFDRNRTQDAIFHVKSGKPELIYKFAPEAHLECGVTGHKLTPKMIELKMKDGVHSVVAVEVAYMQNGCSGSPEKVKSTVFLYDLSTGRKSSDLTASAYCEADKSGGGKNSLCNPKDKKPTDYGIRYRFDWARCDKQSPCDQVHFEKIELGTKKKPQAFVLKWDDKLNLREAAF
jgi:hypothetical protein